MLTRETVPISLDTDSREEVNTAIDPWEALIAQAGDCPHLHRRRLVSDSWWCQECGRAMED